MAILFNLTTSLEQANLVSEGLTKNWNNLGPVCPELPDTTSPFISSLEVRDSLLVSLRRILRRTFDRYKHTSYPEMTFAPWT